MRRWLGFLAVFCFVLVRFAFDGGTTETVVSWRRGAGAGKPEEAFAGFAAVARAAALALAAFSAFALALSSASAARFDRAAMSSFMPLAIWEGVEQRGPYQHLRLPFTDVDHVPCGRQQSFFQQ